MESFMDTKIPLPKFLKALSSNGISVKKAMEMTGKMLSKFLFFILNL